MDANSSTEITQAAKQIAAVDGLDWGELLPGTRQRYITSAAQPDPKSKSPMSWPRDLDGRQP